MPSVTLTGVNEKLDPLHIAATVLFAIFGLGLTGTVTVNVLPVQSPDFGVTVYITFINALLVLVNVPLIEV
jgi:hypothetical protein